MLAVDGGTPVRDSMLNYGRQSIDESDIKAVVDVLRSDFMTTGPNIAVFEEAFADYVGAKHAVAVSNGTAALHAAVYAAGLSEGDEAVVSDITFAASANCLLFEGASPIFGDVDPGTLLLDPEDLEAKITPKTKAVIAVDYAGQPCEYKRIREICDRRGLVLISDSCHAVGARYDGKIVGSIGDMSAFSFHPVKHIATGEGGDDYHRQR